MIKYAIIFTSCLLIFSCAKQPSRHSKQQVKVTKKSEVVEKGLKTQPAQRSASLHLVEEGRVFMNTGKHDQAIDLFQEAISVDPSNGEAYYELANAKFQSQKYGDVLGLLDKAESLLKGQPEWTEQIAILRHEVSQRMF